MSGKRPGCIVPDSEANGNHGLTFMRLTQDGTMPNQFEYSSNTSQSDSSRATDIRVGSTENTDPDNSNFLIASRSSRDDIPTTASAESRATTEPKRTSVVLPMMMTVTLSDVLEFFHMDNFSNASEEEAMFLHALHFKLLANAKILACEAEGRCDRAYRELISAMVPEFSAS